MPLSLHATLAPKIGFASHQNAVPFLHELVLKNGGDSPMENLSISLRSDPDFLEPKVWHIDAIRPGDEIRLSDREVRLSANFLRGLAESVRGHADFEVYRHGEPDAPPLVQQSFPVELLSPAHWGGAGTMPELLPAFCLPNDPAVDRILKRAGDLLRRAGKEPGIDGYQDRSRSRTWELASAIWSAVCGLGLSYAHPPASFETEGQKIRSPGAILDGKLATCLDTSMLFASALEQAGLNPILILSRGHAFVGLWLQPQAFAQLITDEAAAIRKRIELQELVAFETTLVTRSPPPPFSAAVAAVARTLSDEEFQMAIDIRRARMRRILPLALATAPATTPPPEEGAAPGPAEALEEAPPLPGFDVEPVAKPDDASGRIGQWQRKLLDLTARNRLLHLPERSKHVPLLCPDPSALEDLLSAGKTIRISPLPDLEGGGRDLELYRQHHDVDLVAQYAAGALASGEVLSPLPQKKLEAELVDLYRKANTDASEGGANTLFLALGFLLWKKSAEDPRTYRAPLILLPVTLRRRSARSGVTMSAHEDEPRFNLTLLELLRQDFALEIPGLDGALPEDSSGVDVPKVWNLVRLAVKEIPGFEVITESAIGTFSFSKYLMWKDLVDRRDQLVANPVVRHLVERGEEAYASSCTFPRPAELDQVTSPKELFTPLPADSSQLAAIVASERGCDFVLDGPPGTGKSQTIANMIVHNLLKGKKVLFVAEKMAALDVVYRRLKERGLGDFCLEVHSHKSSKLEIIRQLDRAWDVRGDLTQEEWDQRTGRLRELRDQLNLVCRRLHHLHPNGLSVHRAIGLFTRDANPSTPRLTWDDGTDHTAEELGELRATARRLDLHLEARRDAPPAFAPISHPDWSHGWQEQAVDLAGLVPEKLDALRAACDKVLATLQAAPNVPDLDAAGNLAGLARALLATHRRDFTFAFAPDRDARQEAATRFVAALEAYRKAGAQLSVRYADEAARAIDPDQVDASWALASSRFWPLRYFAQKKVARQLAAAGGTAALPDPPADSPHLRQMKGLLAQMDSLAPLLSGIPGYAALESEPAAIASATATAAALSKALSRLAAGPEELVSLKAAARRLAVEANELLDPGGALAAVAHALEGCLADCRTHLSRLADLTALPSPETLPFTHLSETCRAIVAHQPQLRSWCNWQRVRGEADRHQLGPLVAAIESGDLAKGQVEPAFVTAYARWFAARSIDRDPVLCGFASAEHMDAIEEFRALEDRVADLSAQFARTALAARLPEKSAVGRKDGYGILKHELQKKRRHKPLRQLITEMGESFSHLAPCMLMSPLSIAQYLPVELQLFDLVIFDEASQITPWDAVGAIARGRQVIVAGDPRQMPPTNFFQRDSSEAALDEEVGEDLESILDECLAVGIPRHGLSWHYRSRHESLIAFSNLNYYGGDLITFPAAETRDSAVAWRKIDGVYAKGSGRTNQVEARAIVAETLARLLDPGFRDSGQSLGIITLNADQQALIEDLLDEARREHPEIEPFFDESLAEPLFVKNLETVQGDERDVIFLGIGYGPTTPGANTMSMNFGPLNRDGGERRLNVAVTRSRREMLVFTSFDPSMIDLNRTGARAVRDLKHFLEFADRGPSALGPLPQAADRALDSPLEEAIATSLAGRGWEVLTQVGVSRFRVDLAVVHPDRPGDFLAGIGCDGATYRDAATARDRDKIRAAVLEGLGWTLLRVWATDWFVDPAGELERLDARLRVLLEQDRAPRP